MTHIELTGNHGLQHLLGINEANSNPDQVDLSSGIIPVIDMSMCGHLKLNETMQRGFCLAYNSLNASAINLPVLDYGNVAVPGAGTIAYPVGTNFRVMAWSCYVVIEVGAWGATYNGRNFVMQRMITVNGSEWCPITTGNVQINSNNPYQFYGSINGTYYGDQEPRNLIVPAGAKLSVGIFTNGLGGTVFDMDAANNVSLHSEIVGMAVPVGAPVPSFW